MNVKISRITTQKKKKNRYNIYLTDGEKEDYGFSVDEDVLIEFGLRKGLELDKEMLAKLMERDEFQKSYTLAINYLSYRMRSMKEMKDYLVKKEVEPEHVTKIMSKLAGDGYLDDQQFANAFALTRINTSSKGPLLVKRELLEKGVSQEQAEKAIEQYTYEIQFEKARKWAQKKQGSTKKESFKKQLQKLGANLIQKGFTQDVIQDVLQDFEAETKDDTEWDALVYQGEKLVRKFERKYEGFELKQKVKEGLYRKGFSMDGIHQFIEEMESLE